MRSSGIPSGPKAQRANLKKFSAGPLKIDLFAMLLLLVEIYWLISRHIRVTNDSEKLTCGSWDMIPSIPKSSEGTVRWVDLGGIGRLIDGSCYWVRREFLFRRDIKYAKIFKVTV